VKLKYEKTSYDRARELSDARRNPIMRFLKHQDNFKFNVGDILIKQRRFAHDDEWETEVITGVNTPKKFMYVFENDLGIGYVKQLRVDGSGFTTTLVCTANFDPDTVRFQLDPEYVDHILIGDTDFQYNKEYLGKKAFREEATKNNTKILVRTRLLNQRIKWLATLKVGDVFWMGNTLDELHHNKLEVVTIVSNTDPLKISAKQLIAPNGYGVAVGKTFEFREDYFASRYVTMKEQFPMEDPLCDRPK
jgi:hypothetical protein